MLRQKTTTTTTRDGKDGEEQPPGGEVLHSRAAGKASLIGWHLNLWQKSTHRRVNSKCKGPETRRPVQLPLRDGVEGTGEHIRQGSGSS